MTMVFACNASVNYTKIRVVTVRGTVLECEPQKSEIALSGNRNEISRRSKDGLISVEQVGTTF